MNDEILFNSNGEFMKIKNCNTTPYYYAERKGIDSVAFILFDENNTNKFGVTKERKPPLDDRYNKEMFLETAFGGSNDKLNINEYLSMDEKNKIKNFKDIVKIEVNEESGYNIPTENIKFISKEFVSTQMNQWCYLFLVDVTDIELGERHPENETEAQATTIWKTLKQIKESNDWKSKSIVFNFIMEKVLYY